MKKNIVYVKEFPKLRLKIRVCYKKQRVPIYLELDPNTTKFQTKILQILNDMWRYSMIELVHVQRLMIAGEIFLPKKLELLKRFHQQ